MTLRPTGCGCPADKPGDSPTCDRLCLQGLSPDDQRLYAQQVEDANVWRVFDNLRREETDPEEEIIRRGLAQVAIIHQRLHTPCGRCRLEDG